jgi:hypothetical protein
MNQPYFPPDYLTARQRFQAAVDKAGGVLHQLPLNLPEVGGTPLGIDIAWFGTPRPRQAMVHMCGIHGVEGFAGSAVQLALLADLAPLAEDCALILVHVLNPYGMAYLRRANENNVDLNRNFFFGTGGWQGAPAGYATLNRFLNPPYPPARISSFHVRMLLAELSLGGSSIRQAVAGGQYEFPKGIFFGGSKLEQEPAIYGKWLGTHLKGVQELCIIDVHTGLGDYGNSSLFLRSDSNPQEVEQRLGTHFATDDQKAEVMGYEHEGGHSSVYRHLLPETTTTCITQEFGTYNGRRLLRALRAENQYHHYGEGRIDHWSKRRLKMMFCPEDERWRNQVVTAGISLVRRALKLLVSGGTGRISTTL